MYEVKFGLHRTVVGIVPSVKPDAADIATE